MAGQVRRAGAVLVRRGAGARHGRRAGDLLVVATDDGRVTAWDVATGTARSYLPGTVPGLTGREVRVRCLALDLSGTWLAASVEGRLLLWDVADPSEPLLAAGLPCPAEVTALAFDDTGWRLAAGDEDGKVHVWNLAELAATAPVNAAPGAAAFGALSLETTWVDRPAHCRMQAGRTPGGCWHWPGMTRASAGSALTWPARTAGRRRRAGRCRAGAPGSRVFRCGPPRSAPMAASRR